MNRQKKILIADDEAINLDFFDLMLSKLGYSVEKARDGEDALEKVRKFHPDLVLLDNIMPKMTGFELTKIIKNDSKYRDIPIIMLSALDDVKAKVEGFELGVEDYITKPFNFYEVLSRIKAALRNREIYAQIVLRESRLALAEKLNADMKNELTEFAKTVDEIEKLHGISAKSKKLKKHLAEINSNIEKTITEWEQLKKREIDLPVLETEFRTNLKQE